MIYYEKLYRYRTIKEVGRDMLPIESAEGFDPNNEEVIEPSLEYCTEI